ncbi:MAG: precorrin-8X methylmutase [Lachnospiraceae bacterium]|nr:precorrin-8X methylmutase [Lachnospiraceae bacterium]
MPEQIRPEDIEKRSFEIITEELQERGFQRDVTTGQLSVIKRCIHTTADFDYSETLCFSDGAVETFQSLIREGATVVTDTNMALSGINKQELKGYGCDAVCFMADADVASEAVKKGVTRASVSMNRAMSIPGPVIFVIGNAPTALITLRECYDAGMYTPAFVIGVPVGFVNVVDAKELITESDIPYIVNRGRKGGSNVAAAIVNALLYDMRGYDQK